jgi:hypothetical protein
MRKYADTFGNMLILLYVRPCWSKDCHQTAKFFPKQKKNAKTCSPIGIIFPWLYIPEFLPQQTSEPWFQQANHNNAELCLTNRRIVTSILPFCWQIAVSESLLSSMTPDPILQRRRKPWSKNISFPKQTKAEIRFQFIAPKSPET